MTKSQKKKFYYENFEDREIHNKYCLRLDRFKIYTNYNYCSVT